MKIAVVSPILPVPWDGTRGRPIFETVRALGKMADVTTFFVTAEYPRSRWLRPRGYLYRPLPDDYSLPGLTLHASTYPAVAGLSRPLNGFTCAAHLVSRLRRHSPDVILGYWIFPEGFGAVLAARRLGIPCVLGARGSDIRVRDSISKWFTKRALRAADELVMVSQELGHQAVHAFGAAAERVHVINNGCDSSVFFLRNRIQIRRQLQWTEDAETVLYVGRFVEAKGLRELLSAVAQLVPRRPSLQLVLVGDGVFRDEMEALILKLGLAAHVTVTGAVAPAKVAEWMSAADVLCLPSYSEGYPNVLVESLACGTPVVATDVGGAQEIVDTDSGLLIPPRDMPALAQALDTALSRPWDRSTLTARFSRSWEQVAAETLEVCQSAIRRRRPGI